MPDQYGFNHLGDEVRCIDCPSGGPLGQWPEHKRARHGRTHGRTHGHTPKPVSTDLRRQRSLLTAPTTTSNEEKEAIMATEKKGESAKQVAIDILRNRRSAAARERDRQARHRLRPLRRTERQDTGGDDQRHARRRLQARRPVQPRRQRHLHPRQHRAPREQASECKPANDGEAPSDAQARVREV
jgi:hypothetical protein